MAVLAFDIGTTKICAIVVDEKSGAILECRSEKNAFLPAANSCDRRQNPEKIFAVVEELASGLLNKYRFFRCIGVTGQMHGILYLDSSGRAVSPLFTWQDSSASLAMENGETYSLYLKKISPGPISPGYGLATCFFHLKNNQIPKHAARICTIGDYVAMRLCASRAPVMHATNAGGMGFFNLRSLSFDEKSLELAGLDPSLLPETVAAAEVIGETPGGIPVCVSIGDNQAGFLGSVQDSGESILVNIGTGSQISFLGSISVKPDFLEARPFFDGHFLLVGASLCGGRAYAMLESFFRQVLLMAGSGGDCSLYEKMDAAADSAIDAALQKMGEPIPGVNTLFAGSRSDPSARGCIQNITENNFTPANLAAGFLNGMAQELYDFYAPVKEENDVIHKSLVGGGNGIRKSRPLRRILSEKFNMLLKIPLCQEEAAYGAALFALTGAGYFKNVSQAQRLVRYQ